jgi:hypothetical protein
MKTVAIIIAVGLLGFIAFRLTNGVKTAQMAKEALSDFAVKDTATIDKLILTDTEGNEGVELTRTPTGWEMNSGECVQQHLVSTILETIRYIKVKSPVSKASIPTVNKNLTAHHKKVEIFQNGQLLKTWYIGTPTQDNYGTYMLLKDPVKGKSPEPFIMHMPNNYGSLKSRFITDPLEFECTGVFNYNPINIAEVNVVIPDSSFLNYRIVAEDDNRFRLFNNEKEIANFDTTFVRGYLTGFRKIHFESHNYVLDDKGVDSLKKVTPFYTISVKLKEGDGKNIRLFKRKYDFEKRGLDGEILEIDQDRLWVELEDGTLVVGQYHVFQKLLRRIDYFTH